MSDEITVNLPKLGESIHSATIVQWFKQVGDAVDLDEPLLEVSTDKVNSEIPSPVAGVVKEILVLVDQEIQVGEPMLIIAPGGAAVLEPKKATGEQTPFFSPALLRMAKEKGVSMDELSKIPATGAEERLTKKDLEAYLAQRGSSASFANEEVERIPMVGMRKVIADILTKSHREVPHAALVCQVDLTDKLAYIKKNKEAFLQAEGCKLTVTSFVLYALAQALKEYPMLNAEIQGNTIVVKHFINIGVAVSIEDGLLVPVIKGCHTKGVKEMARALADVSKRAREGSLAPDEVKEGTVTMSNFGISGMTMGFPIIRYPEVAILGMAGIEKRLVVTEDDQPAVRSLVNLSLSFDHRVVDGMYGCNFLSAVKKNLEGLNLHLT